MHPPSQQLLRSLRSALRPPTAYCQMLRQSIPRASSQLSCLNISRNLSYSPACQRSEDDEHSRKPSQKSTPRHDRRFDLSTADLKPIAQEQRARTRADAEKESKKELRDGKEHGFSSSSSSSSDKQRTDIRSLDVFADVSAPTTAIDACVFDGFHFNNGLKITGGDGCLLVDGEVFTWRPWEAAGGNPKGKGMGVMVNEKGQWEIGLEAFGVLNLVWPRPGKIHYFTLAFLTDCLWR